MENTLLAYMEQQELDILSLLKQLKQLEQAYKKIVFPKY